MMSILNHASAYKEIHIEFEWSTEFLNNAAVRNRVYGLVEIDVTKAREIIASHKEKTGEKLSFTGWVIKCIAEAVTEHPEIQGLKKGKNDVVVFDDVDVSLTIERKLRSQLIPLPHVIRKANEKSFKQIHEEIRTAQNTEIRGDLIGGEKLPRSVEIFLRLPGFLRKVGWWKLRRDPFLKKQLMGTVGVTSIGTVGPGTGFVLMIGFHSLEFGIGGILERMGSDGKLKQFLCLTVMLDEDVSYGAPAMRFVSTLGQLMENGFALDSLKSYSAS
jgi:2-oxoacid dehydrogenases acyltransferase (catalytic domain)